MRPQTNSCAAVLAIALAAWMDGCVGEEATEPSAVAARPLIGGFEADSRALDAIGSIGELRRGWSESDPPYLAHFCIGTLISERAVLTSARCVRDAKDKIVPGLSPVVFSVGPNTSQARRTVEVVDGEVRIVESDDWRRLSELGLLYLREPVTEVAPLRVGVLDDQHVGQPFAAIGYGPASRDGEPTTRRIGAMHVAARSGRLYELIFGSFPAFYAWYRGLPLPTGCEALERARECEQIPFARELYEGHLLETTHQVLAGMVPSDAVVGAGDLGGPLLRLSPAGLTLYALYTEPLTMASGLTDQTGDHGAVYASFAPEELTFLDRAARWVDPCEGLPNAGICDGTIIRRCGYGGEFFFDFRGPARRIIEFECAASNMICVTNPRGKIGCAAALPEQTTGGLR